VLWLLSPDVLAEESQLLDRRSRETPSFHFRGEVDLALWSRRRGGGAVDEEAAETMAGSPGRLVVRIEDPSGPARRSTSPGMRSRVMSLPLTGRIFA
jgi:hypothetical protein